MNILVTGGSGFVGRHLLKELAQTNHKIACISRQELVDFDSIKIILGDLSMPEKMRQELIKFQPDVIIHLSWQGIPDYSQVLSKLNLNLSIKFFDFILENTKCHKIICSGSCWEYGKKQGVCAETDLINIDTYFTWAKHSLHQYLLVKCAEKNIVLNWFRIFYVYGPSQRGGSLIPTLIKSIGEKKAPQINTPLNKNDFVYVGDVTRAFVKAVNVNLLSGVYNIGSGCATSVYDICKIVEQNLLGTETLSKQVLNNGQLGATVNFWANMEKTEQALNMICDTNIGNGIKQYIQSVRG